LPSEAVDQLMRRQEMTFPIGCQETPSPGPALRDHPLPQRGEGSELESTFPSVAAAESPPILMAGDKGAGCEGVQIEARMIIR
jgi:hypothetical protein